MKRYDFAISIHTMIVQLHCIESGGSFIELVRAVPVIKLKYDQCGLPPVYHEKAAATWTEMAEWLAQHGCVTTEDEAYGRGDTMCRGMLVQGLKG